MQQKRKKILQIGNYPPPMCGWAVQTVLLNQELRRRGHASEVLNVNENRKIKSRDYVDVQNGLDFWWKVVWFTLRGYQIHAHVNAESRKLYLLDLAALLIARAAFRPAVLTFHGGMPQKFFPRVRPRYLRVAFQLLFALAGPMTCDSAEIKRALVGYGVAPERIAAIPCFSSELLRFNPASLPAEAESFLLARYPVFLCYVSFRPEYRLPILRQAMRQFRARAGRVGFIWLGFPQKEMPAARAYVDGWPAEERESLLLLGNLPHEQFLSLMARCFACIRTPACDGISASVLEALALGVPVVASENGRRPAGVLTYVEDEPAGLCAKLHYLADNYAAVRRNTRLLETDNNTIRTADWITGESRASASVREPLARDPSLSRTDCCRGRG